MSSSPFPGKPAEGQGGPRAKGPSRRPSREPHACELNCVGFKATHQIRCSPVPTRVLKYQTEADCVDTDLERMSAQLPLSGSRWAGENRRFRAALTAKNTLTSPFTDWSRLVTAPDASSAQPGPQHLLSHCLPPRHHWTETEHPLVSPPQTRVTVRLQQQPIH